MKYDIPGQHRWEDPPQRIGEPDLGILPSGILCLIDTHIGSPNSRYVKQVADALMKATGDSIGVAELSGVELFQSSGSDSTCAGRLRGTFQRGLIP